MIIPPTIDLTEVAKHIAGKSQFKRLEKSIVSAGVAQSCASDLRECADCIEVLSETFASPRGVGSRRRDVTLGALLTAAAILYGRATITQSGKGERGSVSIHQSLGDDQSKQDHEYLKAVRNRAIAHVHNGEHIGDLNWHRSATLIVKRPEGWTVGAANHRVQFDEALFDVLKRQQPIALRIVMDVAMARLAAVADAIKALSEVEFSELGMYLRAAPFDGISFFGNAEEAYKSLATTELNASSMFTVRR